jgi:hypothetical protein
MKIRKNVCNQAFPRAGAQLDLAAIAARLQQAAGKLHKRRII